MNNIFTTLLYQMEKHHDTVLCTIIADNGSTPRGRGARCWWVRRACCAAPSAAAR